MKLILKNSTKVLLNIIILFCLYACGNNDDNSDLSSGYNYSNDGMLVIDGKRVFIIGAYHHPKVDNSFKELRDNGYNYVYVSPDKAVLDSAALSGDTCT